MSMMKSYQDILKYNRLWYEKNRDKRLKKVSEYNTKNRNKINLQRKNRKLNDPRYKAKVFYVSKMNRLIKFIDKKTTSQNNIIKYVGCTKEQLKQHLQSQFTEGMTWENYGKWHIDHIKPLSKFDLTNDEEAYIALNYKNIQPLWAIDNILKSNK